ncbi:hypothetical protein KJ807_05620 [Patescibacteria group bacterium]|nr:hypothetical protein [Patescibacteria group bacterium]
MASQFTVDGIARAEASEKIQKERSEARERAHKQEIRREMAPQPRTESIRKAVADREKKLEAEKAKIQDRDKQRKLIKIHKYITNPHFAFLSELHLRPLSQRPTYEEVCFMYDAIREAIDSRNGCENIKNLAAGAASLVEQFWGDGSKMTILPEELRFDLRNSATYMRSGMFNSMLDPIANEVAIEYPILASAGLLRRTAAAFLQMFAIVHKMNTDPNFKEAMSRLASMQAMSEAEMQKSNKSEERQ